MSKWIKQFLMAGLAGLIRPKHNRKYSLETKVAAVKAYLSSAYSNQELLQRYQIRNISQLHQWVISYNSGNLTVNQTTRKRARRMGRKVTFDERRVSFNGRLTMTTTIRRLLRSITLVINAFILGYASTRKTMIGQH